MSAAAVLDEAIRLVTRGWCQGAIALKAPMQKVAAWSDDACMWCLSGALSRARHNVGDGEGYVEAVNLVGDIIAGQEGKPIPIEQWNDRRERTQADVVRVLAKALLVMARAKA